jgi:uncharacterized protein YcbK (DUF882 family)
MTNQVESGISRPAVPSWMVRPTNTTRRGFLNSASVVMAPALLLPSKSWSTETRPDAIDGDFWMVPRDIAVVNANTGKHAVVRYWDGAYIPSAYAEMCYLLEDHREHLAVQMRPALFDLVYGTQRWYTKATGKTAVTEVTSGYRTYRTNVLVGGAPGGLHPLGAALDGRMRGVSLPVYAAMLMKFAAGGIGLYPKHVHWDVGRKPAFWRSGQVEF